MHAHGIRAIKKYYYFRVIFIGQFQLFRTAIVKNTVIQMVICLFRVIMNGASHQWPTLLGEQHLP
jgi:hypothetical protein